MPASRKGPVSLRQAPFEDLDQNERVEKNTPQPEKAHEKKLSDETTRMLGRLEKLLSVVDTDNIDSTLKVLKFIAETVCLLGKEIREMKNAALKREKMEIENIENIEKMSPDETNSSQETEKLQTDLKNETAYDDDHQHTPTVIINIYSS